jgi:hypothetical protein
LISFQTNMPRPKAAAIGKPSSVIKATASDIYFIV